MSALLELRKSGLGGTDASAVLGLNPWRTPLQVWCEKRGLAPEQEQTEAMRWGIVLEPIVAERYAVETGRQLIAPEQVYHHPEHDFLLGTPDRLVVGEKRGVEIKTASAYTAHEWGTPMTDEVPRHYLVQCMHYMSITGMRVWDVAVLIGGNDFRIYTVRYDAEAVGGIVAALCAWWQRHMIEGVEPDAMAADNDFLARRFPRDTMPDLKAASTEAFALAADLKLATADMDAASERVETAKAALKALIAEGAGIEGEHWRVTWKAIKDRTRVDWEALARDCMAISKFDSSEADRMVANYSTTTPGPRVFRYTEKDATS